MTTTGDTDATVVDRLARLAVADEPDASVAEVLATFVRLSLAQSDPVELAERGEHDVLAAMRTHWNLGFRRARGDTVVQVVAPPERSRGWRSRRSAVMIVTDDAPFLVDTVRLVVEERHLGVHLMVHPILKVHRDGQGHITGFPDRGGTAEAWTLIEIDRCGPEESEALADAIRVAVAQVHYVVGDFDAMRSRVGELAAMLEAASDAHADEAHSASRLLDWLTRRHFVFLAASDYELVGEDLRALSDSGLGLWREEQAADPPYPGDEHLLSVARTDGRSPVHRRVHMTSISVRLFDDQGQVVGVRRVAGLFSAAAYRESVTSIPLLRERVAEVNRRSGYPADSHSGRALRTTLESFPRDTLFEIDTDTLADVASGIVALQERPIVRVFAVPGPGNRYATVMVYLPRSRFTSEVADRIATLVGERFGAREVEHETTVGTESLARVTATVVVADRTAVGPDLDSLGAEIDALTTLWWDRLERAAVDRLGETRTHRLLSSFKGAVPADYQASVDPSTAVDDLTRLAQLIDTERMVGATLTPVSHWTGAGGSEHGGAGGGGAERHFRVFLHGTALPLSRLLPILEDLGLTVIDQRPYHFALADRDVWLFDIGVACPSGVDLTPRLEALLYRVFAQVVEGTRESDGFNRLVLVAGLDGRQVDVVRSYAKYLRQVGFPFSQTYVEDALARHPEIVADLMALFDARFDPDAEGHRDVLSDAMRAEVLSALDAVPSLDDDRVGRIFLALIDATLRTNVFVRDEDGQPPPVMAFKFDPTVIPDLPLPLPAIETWVCSPRVEGVHLRGGPVARGGLRHSDRREDFRTEVLGLMKAQMVKNAVIVPTGAKGGFVVKRPPESPAERRQEAVDCYRMFVSGLLDVVDNIVDDTIVHPARTVCHDDDDAYLVVAADKGTATFSDLANEVALARGFWLGDAFASGGRTGYDHKVMGITARGAWESVRRHARVLGLDADRDELTVVGIGDMSGDVFGNGMLLSPHLRLVAAFDHRHVFLDPDPSPAAAHAERARLFELPGSSWADYDPSLISEGGGVHPRTAKAIPLSPQVRTLLDVTATSMTPHELIAAVLRAPVDVLWNGGVGTYVKASIETHADVGDRSNDAVRVDACDLRCRMVAEGGNLGLTQRGRIEYSLGGGLINTDSIDNSAGVDCSDHEVNLKVLLNGSVAEGALSVEDRNDLLASMTADVSSLVLQNNRAQTLALVIARAQAYPMVNVHARYLQQLEVEGWLNRGLEFLPTDKQLVERESVGQGLTPPEFSVMLSYTKWADVVEILGSDLPDDPYLLPDLHAYFPEAVRQRFGPAIEGHRLRREIVATQVVNQLVNLQGISFDHRMTEETGLPVAEVCRAWLVARDVFDQAALWAQIDSLPADVPLEVQLGLFIDMRAVVERLTLWLMRRGQGRDMAATVATFQRGFGELATSMHEALTGTLASLVEERTGEREAAGVPHDLACRSALWPLLHVGLDLVELAHHFGRPMLTCAKAYWGVFDRLDLGWLWQQVGQLPRSDRWESQARSAVRDDLVTAMASIAHGVLATGRPPEEWLEMNDRAVTRMRSILREIQRGGEFDLTTLTVAVRQLRNLALASNAP